LASPARKNHVSATHKRPETAEFRDISDIANSAQLIVCAKPLAASQKQ
jgi:hypothetical protein